MNFSATLLSWRRRAYKAERKNALYEKVLTSKELLIEKLRVDNAEMFEQLLQERHANRMRGIETEAVEKYSVTSSIPVNLPDTFAQNQKPLQ